jgi:hypothetical protein
MAAIDTRHDERNILFQVLVAKHNNDFDTLLMNLMAKMEKDDVKDVTELFEQWKKQTK